MNYLLKITMHFARMKRGKSAPGTEPKVSAPPLTLFRLAIIFLFLSGLAFPVVSQDQTNSGELTKASISHLLGEIRMIWPYGNCADNITINKNHTLLVFACKADYSADNRKIFLDKILANGWQLRREDYHIDKNSAAYFYKFQANIDHDVYIKLFFRDPSIIWPLHENTRPKIFILLNDVQSADEMRMWTELKLPLTLSVSATSGERDAIIELAQKFSFDTWLFLPDSFRIEDPKENHNGGEISKEQEQTTEDGSNEDNVIENQTSFAEDPQPDSINLQTLTEILKEKPDPKFPYSGISISDTNPYIKNIEKLRTLFTLMKKEGLKKFIGPAIPEITDTARIKEMVTPNQTYYLGSSKNNNETAWRDAYENSKINGYSVIVLDARNIDARNFLLKMIQETISFIDYSKMDHIP